MIIVSLLGMDSYQAIQVSKRLHKRLVEVYHIDDSQLMFYAPESFLIHDGIEQTSFRLDVKVEASEQYEDKEREARDVLFEGLKDVAVHIRVLFSYFKSENEYMYIDETYPEFMNDSNTVKAEVEEDEEDEERDYEEEYDEPYMGDIIGQFDEYIKKHPDATNEEIYQALSGIREDVTEKHHKDK